MLQVGVKQQQVGDVGMTLPCPSPGLSVGDHLIPISTPQQGKVRSRSNSHKQGRTLIKLLARPY